ncbi:MAG: hypothetical protein GY869_26675 [Planctomycetes bacterium]|nr:hypothetical protein [Planctomycetota bacterium]
MIDDLTNIAGLANRLKLPREWLKNQAETGQIPSLRIGRKYLFNVQAVRQALSDRAARIGGEEFRNHQVRGEE